MVQKDRKMKTCSNPAKFLCKILVHFFDKVLGNIKGSMKLEIFFWIFIPVNKKKRDNFPFIKIYIKQLFDP